MNIQNIYSIQDVKLYELKKHQPPVKSTVPAEKQHETVELRDPENTDIPFKNKGDVGILRIPIIDNGTSGNSMSLSEEGSELQAIQYFVDNTPDVRLEVVENIRTRIKMNDYPIQNNLDETLKAIIKNSVANPY